MNDSGESVVFTASPFSWLTKDLHAVGISGIFFNYNYYHKKKRVFQINFVAGFFRLDMCT